MRRFRPVWERSRFLRSGLRRCPRPASGRPVVRFTCFSYSGRIKLLRKIWTAELFALPPFFPLPTVIRRLARAGRPFGCSGGGESAGHTETYSTGNSYGRCRKGKAGNARASSQKRTGRSRSVDISDRKIFRRGVYSIVSSTSPSSTESPVATLISLTVPSRSESMLFSIFIASRIISRWPVPTRSPTAT